MSVKIEMGMGQLLGDISLDEIMPEDEETTRLKNKVLDAFYAHCEREGKGTLEEIRNLPTNVFTALLSTAGREVFGKGGAVLRADPYDRKTANLVSNNNALRQDAVSDLCDFYIDICGIFNKIPTLYGFTKLLNISREVLYSWSSLRKATPEGNDIVKKLTEAQEAALTGRLIDGKQNPVGMIAALNHLHGWNTASDSKPEDRPLTLEEIRQQFRLSLKDGQNDSKSE